MFGRCLAMATGENENTQETATRVYIQNCNIAKCHLAHSLSVCLYRISKFCLTFTFQLKWCSSHNFRSEYIFVKKWNYRNDSHIFGIRISNILASTCRFLAFKPSNFPQKQIFKSLSTFFVTTNKTPPAYSHRQFFLNFSLFKLH